MEDFFLPLTEENRKLRFDFLSSAPAQLFLLFLNSLFVLLLGSPSISSFEPGESSQQEEGTVMMRSENYLPVPGEDKNLDGDFNGKTTNDKSVVRLFWNPVGQEFNSGRFQTHLEGKSIRLGLRLVLDCRCKVLVNRTVCRA